VSAKVDAFDVVFWMFLGAMALMVLGLLGVKCVGVGIDYCRDTPGACQPRDAGERTKGGK